MRSTSTPAMRGTTDCRAFWRAPAPKRRPPLEYKRPAVRNEVQTRCDLLAVGGIGVTWVRLRGVRSRLPPAEDHRAHGRRRPGLLGHRPIRAAALCYPRHPG